MFYPPTIPINLFSFMILALFWGGVSYCLGKRSDESAREKCLFHGLIGVLSSLSSLLLLTAFAFVPDDWSANRIAVPLSWLYGYQIYSDPATSPGNAYFYMPFGLICYFPAAFVGWILNSPNTCLFLGWVTSLTLYLTPFFILINRLNVNGRKKIVLILVIMGSTFSISSLRYVATMVHVDAFGFFCIFSSFTLALPLTNNGKRSFEHEFIFSFLIILSIFIKQTFWPISVAVFLLILIYYKSSANRILFYSVSLFFIFLSLCIWISGLNNFLNYSIFAPSNAPTVLSLYESLLEFIKINWPLIVLNIVLGILVAVSENKPFKNKLSLISFSIMIFLSTILSIYTFTKLGADSNHFILPSALMLMLGMILTHQIFNNPNPIKCSLALAIIILSIIIPAIKYLNTYCGWYLWIHGSHEIALKVINKYSDDRFYFPWQPLSTLIGYKKMYHIDQSLYYENVNKMKERSLENIYENLPKKPFYIPIRPFGADSYMINKLKAVEYDSNSKYPELSGWRIYIVK